MAGLPREPDTADGSAALPGGEPLTPPVPLDRLLGERGLDLRHLAGPATAEVHGVHASEMADPSPYLLGGELLLTAGAELTGAGAAAAYGDRPARAGEAGHAPVGSGDAAAYVERLVRAGVGALGFGVTPVHEVVPQALLDACDRYGLPLLEVPPRTPFTAVARAVWRLMAQARTRELRRVTEAQQSLAAAAARPDPVPAVLSRLAASLGGWAALLSPEPPGPTTPNAATATRPGPGTTPGPGATPGPGTTLGPGTGPGAGTGARTEAGAGTGADGGAGAAAGGVVVPGFRQARAAAVAGGGFQPGEEVLAGLAALAERVGRGGVATATDTLGGTHLAAYAAGGAHVLVLATPARSPGDHTIASVAAVLLSLLSARRPAGPQAAALTRLLLGGDPAQALTPGPWYVVHARGAADPHALAAALGTVLLDAGGDGVRLLTEREPAPQPGWRLGVSAPAGPGALAAADAQARRALQRADAARTPLARHADRGFAGLVGEAEARAHAEALLAPLNPALRATLRTWLAHHGSWDRTAAALGVHRNTVRQRIARCAALLDHDLDDPDTRMELWFALRRDPEA